MLDEESAKVQVAIQSEVFGCLSSLFSNESSAFIGQARYHALAGYLYGEHRLNLPAAIASELIQDWTVQTANSLLIANELERLGAACANRDLNPGLLKGCALIGDVFSDPGTRFTSDIDIFIDSCDCNSMEKLLIALGYQSVNEPRFWANAYKSHRFYEISPDVKVEVELHARVFPNDTGISWKWKPSPHKGFRALEREDLLVHLLGHLGYQHTFLKLFWLVDIDRLIRCTPELCWDRVWSLVFQLNHRRSASAVLWAAQKYLATPIPCAASEKLVSTGFWKSLISPGFLVAPKNHKVRYFLLKHLLKDSFLHSLNYDWHWIRSQLASSTKS